MSKEKEIINKLVKVVAQQQQIITKLAQALPPGQLKPKITTDFAAQAKSVLGALPPAVRAVVAELDVTEKMGENFVKVRFVPNKGSDAAFQAIQKTVVKLQQSNTLPASGYTVQEIR